MSVDRRDFMKQALAAAGGVLASACAPHALAGDDREQPEQDKAKTMDKRTLGKTGRKLSVIGFGGIVVMNAEPQEAADAVSNAVEHGINYFDVAPSYGNAEEKLGPALKPFRKDVFLACKTGRRDRAGAEEELKQSLQRLHTDHLDLYQLHGITKVADDVEVALGKGGAMEAILAAQKAGVIRHIGFSAHSPEAAMAAMREFDFDSILYPINFACHFGSGFETEPIAEAKKRGMGILALKAMARQSWAKDADRSDYPKCWYEPIDDAEQARLALSWALAQGITALLPPGQGRLFELALSLAPQLRDPDEADLAQLRQLAADSNPIFAT